jgi:hypothetical protein
MTHRRRFLILTTAASLVVAASLRAETVDEVVAKNLAALGGPTALGRVQTLRQTSKLVFLGSQASVVVYGKRPNLIRQELTIAGETAVQGFDGTVAWTVNRVLGMPQPTLLAGGEAEALRHQASFGGILASARERGDSVEMVGTEVVRGRPMFHLRVSAADHHRQMHCYLDAQTFLEARIVTDSAAGRFEQELSDYQTVEGLTMPFAIKTTINGRPGGDIVVSKVEVNVALDEKLFQMPANPVGTAGTTGTRGTSGPTGSAGPTGARGAAAAPTAR